MEAELVVMAMGSPPSLGGFLGMTDLLFLLLRIEINIQCKTELPVGISSIV
jgi:hypothetical protein